MSVDLLALLNQSAASLGAHRAASGTASHNLSNANTPGYARQRAELAATLPAERVYGAFVGRGVELAGVSQARDRFLEAQLPDALGRTRSAEAESKALQAVSALDAGEGALADALGTFYASLRQLAQNPADAGLRQAALAGARGLALAFNRTAASLDATRDGVDTRVSAELPQVNALAGQVADLNRQIRIARNSGAEPNDLLDARQKAQDRLVELTGAAVVPDASGDVNLALAGGAALVSGDRAGKLTATGDVTNGGHLAIQLTKVDGTGPTPLPAGMGGELGGLLSARDGAMRTAETAVDQLAFDLTGALNAVHQTGYGLDGVTGRALFDVGLTSAGAATRMEVDPAVAVDAARLATAGSVSSLPGDASALTELIATESQTLSSGLTSSAALAQATADFGAAAQRVQATAAHERALLDNLQGLRESVSGVSIDEELVKLTRAQRGYEAVMKVIQTTDEMLDTLMKLR